MGFETHWSYEIEVDGRHVVMASDDTLSKALSEAFRQAVYYTTIYQSSKVEIVNLHEVCPTCGNTGIQPKTPGSLTMIKCRACKGKFPTAEIDKIHVNLGDYVTIERERLDAMKASLMLLGKM